MAVARTDLSVGVGFEGMSPVPVSSAVQDESSPEANEGKGRRRPPPSGEASGKQAQAGEKAEDAKQADPENDPPQHRIDSLA